MASAQKQNFYPLPAPGDFVWCFFPQIVGQPGPKPRPALVVGVSPSTHEVEVIYGTSQKVSTLYPTEFVLDPSDSAFSVSGLSHRTKFDVATTVKLPFDNVWFGTAPGLSGHIPLPKMGVLHASYMAALQAAVKRRP